MVELSSDYVNAINALDMTLRYGEEAMARMAKRDITKQIAEGLSEVLKYRMSNDPCRDTVIVSGEVWVEKPSAYY